METTDVLIVGAGPVGLTLANDLARRGIDFRIVDALPEPTIEAKAHGLQSRALEALDTIGLGQPLMDARSEPVPTLLQAWQGEVVAEQALGGPAHDPYPYSITIWQQTIVEVLDRELEAAGHQVRRPLSLATFDADDDGVTATFEGGGEATQIRARWMVGCDGGRSRVRTGLGVRFSGPPAEPGKWFIGEFDMDWPLSRDITFWNRHPKGSTVAFFDPITLKWHAWVTTPDVDLPCDLETINALWQEYNGQEIHLTDPLWFHELRVNYGIVDHYIHGRVVLAGDSAHVHSSAGGQGLNTGVQDALNLGWKLGLVLQGAAAPTLLETYQTERHAEGQNTLDLAKAMHQMLYPDTPELQERTLQALSATRTPAEAEAFSRSMSMLHINYCGSPLSRHDSSQAAADSEAGRFVPSSHCRVASEATRLFDVLRGPQAHLLLFAGDDPTTEVIDRLRVLERRTAGVRAHLAVHYVVPSEAFVERLGLDPAEAIVDGARHLRRDLGTVQPEVLYVRPDGYIGFRSQALTEAALVDYLALIYASELLDGKG